MPRVVCTLIDEEQILDPDQLGKMLETTLPQEVELIELLVFYTRELQLRIYTRAFMQEIFDRNTQLRVPTMVMQSDPPVCF